MAIVEDNAAAGAVGAGAPTPLAHHLRGRRGGGAAAAIVAASSPSLPMPSLRLTLLLALASLVCALPILLHLRGFLSSSSFSSSSCLLQQPSSLSHSNAQSSAFRGDLHLLPFSWNLLSFPSAIPPPVLLHIALFVKKWPFTSSAGGLERHALTLHRQLADRGHTVHVFTTDGVATEFRKFEDGGLHFHIFPPNAKGKFDSAPAWDRFRVLNTSKPFDIVHSESVALPAHLARDLAKVTVVSWHGIAYEIIHSDIVRELNRKPAEGRPPDLQKALSERMSRVVEEVKFFPSYTHHVATSDYVGDVLQTIYQIPPENIHVILNGVDEQRYRPNADAGAKFRATWGVPTGASSLVLGAAGRLVKDKGYPLLFEAFPQILVEHPHTYLLIAGDGPWAGRFKALAPGNVIVLGALSAPQLADFYNAIDIFINPTLRSQGLDHTLLEAMLCGKPLLATHFSSITRSIIISKDVGYTFSPNTPSLLGALRLVLKDGKQVLEQKGQFCFQRASLLFTATKMASAYERLFLCIKESSLCMYPSRLDIG